MKFLYSNIPIWKTNTLENAYFGTDEGFWGISPQNDSFILASFEKPELVKSIKVVSDISHPQDKMSPGTRLEISENTPANPLNLTDLNFEEIAEADANGKIFFTGERNVSSIRILFEERSRWVFIDQIVIDLHQNAPDTSLADPKKKITLL